MTDMFDTNRRPGRTTRQIQESPQGAYYVWPWAASFEVPRSIARKLNRTDIIFVSPRWIVSNSWRAANVVVDHSYDLTNEEFYALELIKRRSELT